MYDDGPPSRMSTIPCIVEDEAGSISLGQSTLIISNSKWSKKYTYSQLRSVHIKNVQNFLLKIRLEEESRGEGGQVISYVCAFQSMHLRDLLKMLLLTVIVPSDSVQSIAIEQNAELREILARLKPYFTKEQLKKVMSTTRGTSGAFLDQDVYLQRKEVDISDEEAIRLLYKQDTSGVNSHDLLSLFSQPFIDTFIQMNCSVNQFLNLLFSSYHFDIKNQKNSLDRILAEKLRGFEGTLDISTRINTYSFMKSSESMPFVEDSKTQKPDNTLKPALQLPPDDVALENTKSNTSEINVKDLVLPMAHTFDLQTVPPRETMIFQKKDLEAARELCKIVYFQGSSPEIEAFTRKFIASIEEKYGLESIKYIERLIPLFYKRKTA